MSKGRIYEQFVNKFLKGNRVADYQDYYDIETKNCLYEIKGIKLFEKNKSSLGRYKISIFNHNKFKELAEQLKKTPKYIFVLKIQNNTIYKTMTFESINFAILKSRKHFNNLSKEEVVNISIRQIW